ncbi:FecR family protein [Mucilaginibacter sp. HMF5004]|uniref:FecR family protein n=1 Tax=Mucilaginibacter rivuli TaxID=2857527 RepID=UPI001C5E99D5|nr:FecR family protein [Mucilaginibacter rivuli]MBW4889238.1 FecR family protein [Mucilaginibacter rivuli]
MYEDRILQLLARKMAGEASGDELKELNSLLEQYPDNLYYEEILKQLWDQKPADSIDVDEAFNRHKDQYSSDFELTVRSSQKLRFFTIQRMLVAATILLIAAAAFYFYQSQNLSQQGSLFTEITTTKGIRKKFSLPDGTQVWLNGNSKITFDNNMNTSPTRLVKLIGEAYFDVTKNKRRPFIIHTDKFSIRVLGTAFNVKAYPGDKKTEATLIRGMIELTINDSLQEKFILRPNEKFAMAYSKPQITTAADAEILPVAQHRKLVIEDIKPVEIASKQYIEETSWVDNKLVFKNESMEELIPELERWYNVKIEINNDRVKKYHFTGVFQNETLVQALTYMQIIRPFTFKIDKYDVKIN